MNQHRLSTITELLNKDALNYSVFLQCHCLPISDNGEANAYIQSALGTDAVVDDLKSVTEAEVLAIIRDALSYLGTGGAGPKKDTIGSPEFAFQLAELLSELKGILLSAKTIKQFVVSDGHPAYPVFWDFAFLFVLSDKAIILIGSSSD